jgi:hypothetical protein
MTQYEEFERSQNAALKKSMQRELYECKCGCTWFELLHVNQYLVNVSVVPGQDPAPFTPEDYPILRCTRCGLIKEHELSITNPTEAVTKRFNQMIKDVIKPDENKDSGQK